MKRVMGHILETTGVDSLPTILKRKYIALLTYVKLCTVCYTYIFVLRTTVDSNY